MLKKFFSRNKSEFPLSIGIDFGTTISRICYIDSQANLFGMPDITPIPSIVSVQKSNRAGYNYEWRVGEQALAWTDYTTRIKLEIGKKASVPISKNLQIRAEVLAAKLLWELKSKAYEYNNALRYIDKVTISVPAEWSVIQRQATLKAAMIAGFSNINLIEEPVAAFLALAEYKKDLISSAKNILVFDCGGGTLDITVIVNDFKKVPYVAGRATNIGEIAGENIDDQLSIALIGENAWKERLTLLEQRLFSGTVVRQLKEQLNPVNLLHDPLDHAPRSKEVKIGELYIPPKELILSLERHNKIVNPIAFEAKRFLKLALSNCVINGKPKSLSPKDIDLIIMVGGSSYLRPLQNVVKEFFDKDINQKDIILYEPDKLIAVGAALWQAYQDRGTEKFTPTLAMDTYLKYQKIDNGKTIDKKEYLGHAGDILPITMPKSIIEQLYVPIIDIPRFTNNKIEWKVYQNFAYSELPAVPVEWIKYQGKVGRVEKIRLSYRIDKNGNIVLWQPTFIFEQEKDLTPKLEPLYDWAEKDPENIANDYNIRISNLAEGDNNVNPFKKIRK